MLCYANDFGCTETFSDDDSFYKHVSSCRYIKKKEGWLNEMVESKNMWVSGKVPRWQTMVNSDEDDSNLVEPGVFPNV